MHSPDLSSQSQNLWLMCLLMYFSYVLSRHNWLVDNKKSTQNYFPDKRILETKTFSRERAHNSVICYETPVFL